MKHVLIVDDSATEQQAIRGVLEPEGYLVFSASDGDEALEQLNTHAIDVLLLDVVMPGKNGFQLCRQIRHDERWQSMPIVMVTSKDQAADRFWGMKQGATEYITKPFERTDLIAAIQKHS